MIDSCRGPVRHAMGCSSEQHRTAIGWEAEVKHAVTVELELIIHSCSDTARVKTLIGGNPRVY